MRILRLVWYISVAMSIFSLGVLGCSSGNTSTLEGATKVFVKAMIEADGGTIQKMNKSGELDSPTSFVIEMANTMGFIGSNLNDYDFDKADDISYFVINKKSKKGLRLQFMKMDGKYYFSSMAQAYGK